MLALACTADKVLPQMTPLKYGLSNHDPTNHVKFTFHIFFTQCYYFSESKAFTLAQNSLSLKISMPSKLAEGVSFT